MGNLGAALCSAGLIESITLICPIHLLTDLWKGIFCSHKTFFYCLLYMFSLLSHHYFTPNGGFQALCLSKHGSVNESTGVRTHEKIQLGIYGQHLTRDYCSDPPDQLSCDGLFLHQWNIQLNPNRMW